MASFSFRCHSCASANQVFIDTEKREYDTRLTSLIGITFLPRISLPPPPVSFGAMSAALYRAIALPSAGVLPFMQSVVCDLNGGRSDFASDMPYFPNAT